MPANYSYSPSNSEKDLKSLQNAQSISDSAKLNQGKYQSLGTTTCLVQVCSPSLNTISGDISKNESSSTLNAWSSVNSLKPRKKEPGDEGVLKTLIQVVGPFLVAGVGSMMTGLLLDTVKSWDNFRRIGSLITLVPTLLGLKGNLEMTVTARLCTASNLGILDDPKVLLQFLRDDLLLTQFQATIVSLLASLLTLAIHAVQEPSQINWTDSIVVVSSSVVTAAIACLFLGLLMTGVVVVSRKFRINPDNVCAPLAASLGDISTLAIFSYTSAVLYSLRDHVWIPISLAIVLMILCPVWGRLAWRSPEVRGHLQHGWLPIIIAMLISLGAGYILDVASSKLDTAAAFVPVVSGVCGNLSVILICRMTTFLRQRTKLGEGSDVISEIRADNPLKCSSGKCSKLNSTFYLLLVLPILAHSIFAPIIALLTNGVSTTVVFMAVFLGSVLVHAVLMLFLTREAVLRLWGWGIDPDVASIPILTAIADLFGGAFTCFIFVVLYKLNDDSVYPSPSDGIEFTPFVNGTLLY